MISAHISGIIKGVKSIMFEGIGAFFSRLWTDISGWFVNIYDQFCFVFVAKDRYKQMFTGLGNTLKITGGALLVGIVIGIVVAAIRSSYDKNKEDLKKKGGAGRFFMGLLNGICKIYLTVIRGTPVVVQLMISYFLIFVSAQNGVLVGIFAFGINSGAYVAEIFRGGIMSVDEGQFEAGRSLGFGYVGTMWHIVLPQAFKTVLPTLCNEFIALLKETAVAGYVGVIDLTKAGNVIAGRTYQYFIPLITVAIIYLAIVMIMSWLSGKLERRLRKSDRS